MRPFRFLLLFLLSIALTTVAAAADEWTAVRLRGVVFQLVNGAWQQVHRNDLVPDGNVIRSVANGYADFTRGAETVSVGPDTEIVISDKGGAKPFTTVRQDFGTVTVDAEVENVQHFAVETPYLAAVVKGTKFVVTSGSKGASVKVLRGHVECQNRLNRLSVLLSVGQTATVTPTGAASYGGGTQSSSGGLTVSGDGVLPPILDQAGNVVGGVNGAANGLVNGVANGLKGLTGKDDNNGNGSGNGNAGDDNSGNGNSNNANSGNGNSGNGNGLLGLHLKLGLPTDGQDTIPGLWV